jgi:UDP-N-acetylglucosamine 4,6-dehydratase
MTRFWVSLQEGVEFVLKNFSRMQGGEIFVPKLPSVKIVDLAKAMGSNMQQEVTGIRPGEKLHEIMCPADESHLTLEFHDHFVIKPSIRFAREADFSVNKLEEIGKSVPDGFEFNSGNNSNFLSVEEIDDFNNLHS